MKSRLCLFFHPDFPARVFSRDRPGEDLRGGSWVIDPWRNGGKTVPRRVWLAGRKGYCDLRFQCKYLSRVHFEITFGPVAGSAGVFGILSGGHYPNSNGELEYHPSSIGVWVFDGRKWKKATPGEPADKIDPELNNRLWLGMPNACIVVGSSPEDTTGDHLWDEDLWPAPEDVIKPMITSRLHQEVEQQIKANTSQWDVVLDWGEWLQAAPRSWQEAAWKFAIALLIGLILAIAVYAFFQ